MKKKGLTFKAVINQALREGLSKHRPRGSRPYRQRTFHMGFRPDLPIDKALAVSADLEDGEIIRKLTDRN